LEADSSHRFTRITPHEEFSFAELLPTAREFFELLNKQKDLSESTTLLLDARDDWFQMDPSLFELRRDKHSLSTNKVVFTFHLKGDYTALCHFHKGDYGVDRFFTRVLRKLCSDPVISLTCSGTYFLQIKGYGHKEKLLKFIASCKGNESGPLKLMNREAYKISLVPLWSIENPREDNISWVVRHPKTEEIQIKPVPKQLQLKVDDEEEKRLAEFAQNCLHDGKLNEHYQRLITR
jgi:hypothetical protein